MSTLSFIGKRVFVLTTTNLKPRMLSSKTQGSVHKKVKELQCKFQVEDGCPVYLKGGAKDRIFYLTTLGLCGAGFILIIRLIFQLARLN